MARDYKSTALVSTPGYALHLGSVLQESGIHPDELFLNIGIQCQLHHQVRERTSRGVMGRK